VSKLVETATLVTEVLGDTKTLFELQIKLLQAEMQELAQLAKRFALLGALALAAIVPALFFLGLAISDALDSFTNLPSWACHATVFLLLVTASSIPLLKARSLLTARRDGQ